MTLTFQDTEIDMTTSTPRRVFLLRPVDPATVFSDMPLPAPAPLSPLMLRALRLWPDGMDYAERNRAEWLRAVAVVRGTSNGWRAERHAPRLEKPL
jgi:hypothetical protein